MVLNHQLVALFPPPTVSSWQETVEYDSGRTRLFCVLSVVGQQAANVGKEMLASGIKKQVYSAETAYTLIEQLEQSAEQAGVLVSVAIVLLRGTHITLASLRMGIGLRRDSTSRILIMPDDMIQVREGSGFAADRYVLFTQLDLRIGQQLLQVGSQSTELTRIWQSIPALPQFTHEPGMLIAMLVSPELREQCQIESTTVHSADIVDDSTTRESIKKRHRTLRFGWTTRRARKKKVVTPNQLTVDVPVKEVAQVNGPSRASRDRPRKVLDSHKVTASVSAVWHSLFPSRDVYVGSLASRKKILGVGVLIICALVLIALGSFLWLSQKRSRQTSIEHLVPFEQELGLISQLTSSDPLAARDKAKQQLSTLGQLLDQPEQSSFVKTQIDSLMQRTKSLYDSLDVTISLEALQLFDDLRRFSPSFVSSKTAGYRDTAIFADQEQKLLLRYSSALREGTNIDAASLTAITAVAQGVTQSYILGENITSIASSGSAQLQEVIPQSALAEGGTLIATFDDNVYVLNPSKRALYRYVKSGQGYGKPTNWLTGAVPFPLSDVTSMVVDGDVWFGTNTGEMYHFIGGKQQTFALAGLEKPISNTIYLATMPEHDYVYVLDPSNKRVIMVKKTGQVVQEYTNATLGSATALWLDQPNNRLFIVSGASIYALPL